MIYLASVMKLFSSSVTEQFNVKVANGSTLRLSMTTNLGAPINIDDFAETVQTFHKGNFFINVSYESTIADSNIKAVTPLVTSNCTFRICSHIYICSEYFGSNFQMIQNYFFGKSLGHLLTKEKLIVPEKRRLIVNTIVDFMLEIFGADLTYTQKVVTAQAAVIEFPGLEFKDGSPTV